MGRIRLALIVALCILTGAITAVYATNEIKLKPTDDPASSGKPAIYQSQQKWDGNPEGLYGITADMSDAEKQQWRKLYQENKPFSIVEVSFGHPEVVSENEVASEDVEQWKNLVSKGADFKLIKGKDGKFRISE